MNNSRICSMSMVSKTLYSHFSGQGSYYSSTLGLNFTMESWAEFLGLMSVIMHGPYLKWTQLLCVAWRYRLWAACPCLSWSAVAFSRSIVVELDSEGSIVSTFTQNTRALARVQIWMYVHLCIRSFNLNFDIWPRRTGHIYTYTRLAMQSR